VTWTPRVLPDPPRGPALRDLRAALGLRQVQLAGLLGVSTVAFGQWERGRRSPTPGAGRLLVWLAQAVADDDCAAATLATFYADDAAQFWAAVLLRFAPRHALEGELSRRG
jgi:transcriptional regulator with XRE-family HTH domain